MTDGRLATVIEIICSVGGLARLEPDQDYYDVGLTSVQALPLLLELEDRFQVGIPDDRFINARTATQLCELIAELGSGKTE